MKSFQRIFDAIPFLQYIANTVIFALGATGLALVFDSAAGYAFAQLDFKGKNFLFVVVLLTMMVPFPGHDDSALFGIQLFGTIKYLYGPDSAQGHHRVGVFMMRSYFVSAAS